MPLAIQAAPTPLREYVTNRGFKLSSDVTRSPQAVFKMGRTTGPTAGKVNGCHAVVRVYESGRESVCSTELVIVPVQAGSPEGFASHGDSGALVWNGQGKPDSMVWGHLQQERQQWLTDVSQIAFATPLPSILEDIKATVQETFPGQTVEVALY